jgi:SAM-dependent methyltransferase
MSLQRLELVANFINSNYENYSLLDLGCRTRDLSLLLVSCREYTGTDLHDGEGVVACNLERALPFENGAYEIVCALDVLEHLDNIHLAVSEIRRIAQTSIVISLPNMAHWSFRLNFLTRGVLSGKYKFHSSPIEDRHRWVTNYLESKAFLIENFSDLKIKFIDIVPKRGRTRFISEPIEGFMAGLFPNMFVYGLICIIDLDRGGGA